MAGRRVALLVAVDRYDSPALRQLGAPAADARALAEVLGDPDLGGFAVQTLLNATAAETAEQVEGFLADRQPDDLALLHFSCHGLKDDHGELYLAARGTNPTRLASTAVDAALVDRLMRRSRAQRIVLLLDCCFGGAFERGVVARAGGDVGVDEHFHQEMLAGGRGRIVITASTALQYAFEGAELSDAGTPAPAVFTGAVVAGIRSGEADRDEDGAVGIGELYDYVYDAVRAISPQTPCKWEYGVQGELVVSRAPHRRVRAGRVPQEVAELLGHPHPAVRRSAVGELARLVGADDLPVAVAARAALADLLSDDSRRVSTEAAAALDTTALAVDPPTVDLGAAPPGSPTVVVRVSLRGPPLVEATQVVAVPDGVTAVIRGRVLEVRADTATARAPGGEVLLDGPAGSARVALVGAVSGRPRTAAATPDPRPSGRPVTAPPAPSWRPGLQHLGAAAVVVGLVLLASALYVQDRYADATVDTWTGGLVALCLGSALVRVPHPEPAAAAVRGGAGAAAGLAAVLVIQMVLRDTGYPLSLAVLLSAGLVGATAMLLAAGRLGATRTTALQVAAVSCGAALSTLALYLSLGAGGAFLPASTAAALLATGSLRPGTPGDAPLPTLRTALSGQALAGTALLAVGALLLLVALAAQDVHASYDVDGNRFGLGKQYLVDGPLGAPGLELLLALTLACVGAGLLRLPATAAPRVALRGAQAVAAGTAAVFLLVLVVMVRPDRTAALVGLGVVLVAASMAVLAGAVRPDLPGAAVARWVSFLAAVVLVVVGLEAPLDGAWFPQITVAATLAAVLGSVGLLRVPARSAVAAQPGGRVDSA